MSNLTEWTQSQLYPALFDNIDNVFTEHNFKRNSKGWSSQTYMSGLPHKEDRNKTYISNKYPALICEQGGDTINLCNYVMRRDNITFIEAVKLLSKAVNLTLPPMDSEQFKSYQLQRDKITILEECNNYFKFCLFNSKEAEIWLDYCLSNRGYSKEEVESMELGFIPSQDKLKAHLVNRGFSQELINEVKLNQSIGVDNKLSIPFRSSGDLLGFIFRSIEGGKNKYINSTGLVRSETFFNIKPLKGDKDLIIVEGYLDALICKAKGIDNVVGLGGVNLTSEQIRHSIKKGAEKFTLFLDTDKAGEEATIRAIDTLLKEGISKIYIVDWSRYNERFTPDIKIDPDYLLKLKNVPESSLSGELFFKAIVDEAIPYYEYFLNLIFDKYNEIHRDSSLTNKDIDNLLEEVVNTGVRIKQPIDKDRFTKLFTDTDSIFQLGINKESLDLTIDKIKYKQDKILQAKEFKKLLIEATNLQEAGEIDKALNILDNKVKEVRLKNKATEFSKLLLVTSEIQIREEEVNLPDDLNTGYTIEGDEILLQGGAISVFSAPTNHGKTVFLINTVLNIAQRYPDKKFIFFTYEERANSILQYFLNTYMNIDLNTSDKGNRRLLRDYFKTGSTQYISKDKQALFYAKKKEFFKEFIESGRILIKYVDYNSEELTTAIEYVKKETPNLGGVFIDYFQLLKTSGEVKKIERINSRQEELKQICITLKDLAIRTGLPLVLVAQFNRTVTNLMELLPTNIGEAGDIERVVNSLYGLWNLSKKIGGVGGKGDLNEIEKRTGGADKGIYIEVLKSRDIKTGAYEILDYNGNTGKIKQSEIIEDVFKPAPPKAKNFNVFNNEIIE